MPMRPGYPGGPHPGHPGAHGRGPMHGGPGPHGHGREVMTFPPGSVEATAPLLMKRRKYTKVDVQPVEGWRLVMSLRSGLLMESTWALDVINILMYDDHAFSYFGLANMPGLIEALLEHWRATLIAMFEITQELELSTRQDNSSRTRVQSKPVASAGIARRRRKRLRHEDVDDQLFADQSSSESEPEDETILGRVGPVDPSDKSVALTSHTPTKATRGYLAHQSRADYTKRPRFCDEEVELVGREEELFVSDKDAPADTKDLILGGTEHWAHGGGASTSHIVTHFASDLSVLQFVWVLKSLGKKKESASRAKLVNGESSSDTKVQQQRTRRKSEPKGTVKEEPEDKERKEGEGEGEGGEDVIEKIRRLTGIVFRDPDAARARWRDEALEDENHVRDEPSLQLTTESNESLGKRAVCLSTIFRNLSFLPGNEHELSRNTAFLAIVGRLLLLHHWYPKRPQKQRNYDRGEEDDANVSGGNTGGYGSCTSLIPQQEWWWDYLHVIRENVMVCLANMSGCLDLTPYEEDIARPILDGLLEWAVSSSAYAQDPFPNVGPHSPISPQRLAIETLCKLCLLEGNVDLILSTPPYSRIERLALLLAKKLYRYEDQVLREFSINLLYYLSGADSGVARTIALSDTTVGLLLGFIEQAEQNAMMVAQKHGVNALRDNPESMGTSLDMLRRAASTLGNLSKHPDNIPLFVRQEQRLLALVMSQILDQGVASILSHVLFHIGAVEPKPPSPLPQSTKVEPPQAPEVKEEKDTENSENPSEQQQQPLVKGASDATPGATKGFTSAPAAVTNNTE